MSEVLSGSRSEDPRLAALKADPTRNNSLLAPEAMLQQLDDTLVWMAGNETFYFDVDGQKLQQDLPRFGLLSLILRTTPCYVYGHPALKNLCKTAFTDGLNIFICDDFLERLNKDVEASKGSDYGIELVLLHELNHKLFRHVDRFKGFTPDLANRAADLSINTRLQEAFPTYRWCKSLKEVGLGFRPGDVEKYTPMSEESIARELLNEDIKRRQEQQKDQKEGQGQGKGQPGKGQSGQGKGQPGQGKGQGQGNDPGDGEAQTEFGEDGDNHLIDPETLVNALEEAGLEDVVDRLGLPRSDQMDKLGEVKQQAEECINEAIQKSANQMNECGGKYPGAHIASAAHEYVTGMSRGKLSWRLRVRKAILGDGSRYRATYDVLAPIYYVQEVTDELGTELVLPVELPEKPDEVVLCLIDTSGSVDMKDVSAFVSEILELKTASSGNSDSAAEVVLISADTVLRGDPIEITDQNAPQLMSQGVEIFGRGGTDLETSIYQAGQLSLFKNKNISSVVMFSDLYDRCPSWDKLGLAEGCKVIFVAAPSTHSSHVEEFAKGVPYAEVVEIRPGGVVDFNLPSDTASTAKPKMR
jgi:predicted metal-dependent peptidase